ncbi:MAG: zf-HC2 domain-containing protein [Syntrophobacteraceae bacterium]|nr:zf-HC2 domain-containing protein [Syntrophobacteraceae bacterium]
MSGEKARCQRVQRKLSAYLDGELAAGLCREVVDHLALCPLCRKELEDLAGVDSLVRDMPQVTLPPQFASTVASRAQEPPAIVQSLPFLTRTWKTLLDFCVWVLNLLDPEPQAGTRFLDEFNDIPASFIGHAYFRILG